MKFCSLVAFQEPMGVSILRSEMNAAFRPPWATPPVTKLTAKYASRWLKPPFQLAASMNAA